MTPSSVTITVPAEPVVTLADAKRHLRLEPDAHDDDPTVDALIAAATEYIQNETRTQIGVASLLCVADTFPAAREIILPRPPLRSVELFRYYSEPHDEYMPVDPETYTIDTVGRPGRIILRAGATWPASTGIGGNRVRIDFTAGYDAQDVPALLRQAVLLLIGHWFENREAATDRRIDTIPLAVESIVNQFAFPEAI